MSKKFLSLFLLTILLTALSSLTSACSSQQSASAHDHPMASTDLLPDEVMKAPASVRESYQYAYANPEVLKEIPCYCGCGAMGHNSNYACYVASVDANGAITYDPHALGCSICVDITLDTMRLVDEGKTVAEIKAYVDDAYARFGPSNIP